MSEPTPYLRPCSACPAPRALSDAALRRLCAHRTETVRTYAGWQYATWRRLCAWLKRYPTRL